MWLLLQMSHPVIGHSIFKVLDCHYQLMDPGLGSMCRAHIALQELQAVVMLLHRMAFQLTCKVVALHLDKNTAKAHLWYQGGTVSPFLSRLACQLLNLTEKHSITLIPAYIPTHLCGGQLSVTGLVASEWHLLPHIAQVAFQLWVYQRWIC